MDEPAIVTDTIAKIGGVSYPIVAISSVRIKKVMAPSIPIGVACFIASLVFLMSFFGGEGTAMLVAFGILLALGTYLVVFAKPNFVLILVTAGREQPALVTPDDKYVGKIQGQIEDAICASRLRSG
jgi:hypothetical protein